MTTEDIADTYDAEQVRLMGEMCIVVDEQDNVIRPGTKKECTVNLTKAILCQISTLGFYTEHFLFSYSTKRMS